MKFLIAGNIIPSLFDGVKKGGEIPQNDLGVVFIIAGNVLRILFWVAGVAAVVVIIIAGIMYTTSAGDPQRTAKAKSTIFNAVIGLALVFFAYSIITLIYGRIAG